METMQVNDSTASPSGRLRSVSTPKLLLYMATFMAWEAQAALLLLRALGGIVAPPSIRYPVLAVYIAVNLLAVRYGKEDMQRIKASGGKIDLTGMQMVLVTLFVVGASIPLALVARALIEG